MPQIAQQDYKVIAPKEGRGVDIDAAALAELKKSVLAGIGFDCLLKDVHIAKDGTLDRIIGIYEDGSSVTTFDTANQEVKIIDLPYTVEQYQGLAAVQDALDEEIGLQTALPMLTKGQDGIHLSDDNTEAFICVDGKYIIATTAIGHDTIEALAIAETGPTEDFINITWEDAQKLIGLPLA